MEPDRPEPVRRDVNWMRIVIDEDPRRSVTLADVANAAKVSEKHLCREFARSIGHSPMRVYTLLRLQLALSLLVRSNLSVKELAHRCGFSDAFYFSRCFSKTFDVPPTELRAQIAKGAVPPPNPLPVDITPRVYW